MFDNKKGDEINTGATLDDVEQKQIEGAYGSSELRLERRPMIPGMRVLLIVGFIAIIIISAALSWRAFKMRNTVKVEEEKPQQTVQQVIPSYTPPIEEKPKVIEEPERLTQTEEEEETRTLPSSLAQLLQTTLPPQLLQDSEEFAHKRMLSSALTSGDSSESSSDNSKNNASNDRDTSTLSDKLQPIRLNRSYAAQLRNRDLLITQGTQIDCTLETRIITTQPGMTTCYLTRDVYSTSGRVVLLDRGSKVVGLYQGGLQQGQARIFVQWLRVETPSGVIVNLDSPGTGSLGESGVGGWVDGHFWERFSGAIMISIIGNFGEWVKNKVNKDKPQDRPQSHDFQNAESMVTDVLQNSINIPPTLYKNQGERVNILVARDLDFSDVYSLTTR
ncbi:type IV secretion system protein VirB10 [Bartonella sp. CB74]|uniref:type IV secretion system protein VirB10 n=1 Tax=Bartonella sp. CB74 TaxID=3113620 RepID=UPI002F969550